VLGWPENHAGLGAAARRGRTKFIGWLTVVIVPKEEYHSTPWENGRGMTSDIVLLPLGATRSNFDIRVSIAPIMTDAPFSPFPGIDRHITLLHGSELELIFPTRSLKLAPMRPAFFDNGEPPTARLADGPVEVFNVSIRRGRFSSRVDILEQNSGVRIGENEIGIIFAGAGSWSSSGRATRVLEAGTTAIVERPGKLELIPSAGATAIFALLTRCPTPC
jgi:hypothetical protein